MTFAIPELVAAVDSLNRQLPVKTEEQLRTSSGGQSRPAVLEAARDRLDYWRRVQLWVFLAMMCGFAVKVPMVPLHTWLPLAHVEAPTAGSVLLAGVLLKLGTYGFLRLCVPLAPDAALRFGVPVLGTSGRRRHPLRRFLLARPRRHQKTRRLFQRQPSRLCMLGLFALNEVGLTGSLLQMINHGLSTGGLFLLVGMLYERYHTRKMARLRRHGRSPAFVGGVHGVHHHVEHRSTGTEWFPRRMAGVVRDVRF